MDMSDKIKRLVAYCPDTGQLIFKRASPILFENGAKLLSLGSWPDGEIDHINHVRSDNHVMNLRDASRGENSRNLSAQIRRTGASTGVYWYAATSRWVAKINVQGRGIHIGYFPTEIEAIAARKGAEQTYDFHHSHGEAY